MCLFKCLPFYLSFGPVRTEFAVLHLPTPQPEQRKYRKLLVIVQYFRRNFSTFPPENITLAVVLLFFAFRTSVAFVAFAALGTLATRTTLPLHITLGLGQQHLADKHALRAILRIAMDLIQQKHGAVLNAVALGP